MKFPNKKSTFPLLAALLFFGVVLHGSTFLINHVEGDELVYLGLSKTMTWTAGNYSTSNIPVVNEFPARLYRSPLFIHPPLYPLLLKVGGVLGDPTALGLLLNNVVHLATITLLWWAIPGPGGLVAATLATFCPILTCATNKLHIDGLAGFLLLASTLALMRAMTKDQVRHWIVAGIAAGLFANAKLTALAILPAFFAIPLLDFRNQELRHWLLTRGTFLGILITLSAPHPLRLYLQYGTLYPSSLLEYDRPITAFLRNITARTRLWSAGVLTMLSPALLLLLSSKNWAAVRRQLGAPDRFLTYTGILTSSVLSIALFHYGTERYWALFLPLAYFGLGTAVTEKWPDAEPAVRQHAWLACSVALMMFSTYLNAVLQPQNDVIFPSLLTLIPTLRSFY